MEWKVQLRKLEHDKQWDSAIAFMESVIEKNPNDMDAYIFMNFLLMNLLMAENYDKNKYKNYTILIKKYFDESYSKFSNNAEYLFFTGKTAIMGEWYFGIEVKDYEEMLEKARSLDPINPLYQDGYYFSLFLKDQKLEEVNAYYSMIRKEDSSIRKILKTKGALGEYLLNIILSPTV